MQNGEIEIFFSVCLRLENIVYQREDNKEKVTYLLITWVL